MERRWVANTLNEYELLHALTLIYARMYDCCKSLGEHVRNQIDSEIPTPRLLDSISEEVRHVSYLKLRNFEERKISHSMVSYDSNSIPEKIKERVDTIGILENINSTEGIIDLYSKMAEAIFLADGYHIPILMFFDSNHKVIDLLSANFDDQADKYIFWRFAADRARVINAHGFVWVSELWVRSSNMGTKKAIHKMPIVEEKLQVIGVDANNYQKSISWCIIRENEDISPSLTASEVDDPNEGKAFFMRPILKVIGGDISRLNE